MTYLEEAKVLITKLSKQDDSAETYLDTFDALAQAKIIAYAKVIVARLAHQSGVNMQGACYDCMHRRNVPGDYHSSCANKLAYAIGNDHGISKGWFLFPYNFDPFWLEYCDGYKKSE